MFEQANHVVEGKDLLKSFGVQQTPDGTWEIFDHRKARSAYVHHSQQPCAQAAFSAADAEFASERFPGYTLIDLVDKIPSLDYAEYAALAMACESQVPSFAGSDARAAIFGRVVWQIVHIYKLDGCFERVEQSGRNGDH